ncbi:hypothetical protein BGZ63DRAFT_351007 [Mariannaea sp. PMI_226]|nr:hypothetical protein BGZ63DRAFT_351007 [Mariannaea sp. PMI_226]
MPATPFQTEAWTEYGIGTIILLLRYFARWKTVGFKGWGLDDMFAVLSLVFWTSELVMLELIGQNGTNIGVTDEMGAAMSPEEIAKLEFGSKCLLAGWNFYVSLIWCLKFTMLCFYSRITLGLKQQKVVTWAKYGTAVAYVGVIAVIWGHCTPVRKNWQVYPNPGGKNTCTLAVLNYLVLVVLNICTDFVIVCIPVPLLWKVKLSIQKKLVIGLLLCSGIFIMVATILRCVLSLRDISGINTSTIWAIRETFVGIIAVNAAAIKPLFSASRWIGSNKSSSDRYKSSGYGNNGYGHQLSNLGGSAVASTSNNRHRKMMTDLGDNSSEEHIVQNPEYNGFKNEGHAHASVRAGSTASNRTQEGIMVSIVALLLYRAAASC